MSLYLRRLVSGKKSRYKDNELNIELDLAYVTDRIIVMGFPAVGMESIYRNHRADVQRFLAARHGSNFWVFNFCPLRENTYHESVFEGRVSRYPFPDHYVPPFLYLSLVTQEIHAWLAGSDARVAVLHCKAGKGRSGTLACAYLLSNYASPPMPMPMPSSLLDSLSDWSLISDKGLQTPSPDTSAVLPSDRPSIHSASAPFGMDLSRVSSAPLANSLEKVLSLHTTRRMKPSRYHPDAQKKPKMGVSIPSQQRWLFYWSQVLSGKGPPSLRPSPALCYADETPLNRTPQMTKAKLTTLTVRMREPSRIQPHLVQAASAVITSAGKGRAVNESAGGLWASLARYSDQLVEELEHFERESRGSDGAVRPTPFKDSQRDKAKMIHSFAQMTISDIEPIQHGESEKPILTYVLRPHTDAERDGAELHEQSPNLNSSSNLRQYTSASENSYVFTSLSAEAEEDDAALPPSGIILEANRELRIKLFMGEVALGWVWLIPAFHISSDSPTPSLVLSRDDIDFPIGVGKTLVDIKISFSY